MHRKAIESITNSFEEELSMALKPYGITPFTIEQNSDRIKIEFIDPNIEPGEKPDFWEKKRIYIDDQYAFTIETKMQDLLLTKGVYSFDVHQSIRRENV